ncbi:TPA: YqaJ viral recombinase family protein [Pseudomonas aeruginosa]
MKIHNLVQGTDEWHALRARCFTASEAPVMMAASNKMRRNELLHMKATGGEREYSEWVQKNLFDKGHAYEASARVIVEGIVGEELYPATATDDSEWLLASFDGITMLEDTLFEHKMWNQGLAEAVRNKDLPAEYYWQLEQQLLVSGAERAIFVCSDGTESNFEWMEYRPVAGRAKQLVDGWKQFEADLSAYVPAEAKPEAVGRAPENLPALRIEVTGMVTASNLAAFKAHALDVFDNINRDLQSDQDFANAESTVKWCKGVEDKLEAAKQHALSQTASIDELFRTIDEISESARATRLELDKLVKARKEARRLEIKTKAEQALREHVDTINRRLGKVQLPTIAADFAAAIKGKKTIASLQDAADSELARAKIEANTIAEKIEGNLASLRELARDHAFLFSDAQQLVLKGNDDLVALIKVRISEHEAEQERQREVERERIREEERQRLEREQAEQERQRKEAAEQAAKQPEPEPTAAPEPQPAATEPARKAPPATTYRSAKPATAEIYRAEVVDLEQLVFAAAAGLIPLSVLMVDQDELDRLVKSNGGSFACPGVRLVKNLAEAS